MFNLYHKQTSIWWLLNFLVIIVWQKMSKEKRSLLPKSSIKIISDGAEMCTASCWMAFCFVLMGAAGDSIMVTFRLRLSTIFCPEKWQKKTRKFSKELLVQARFFYQLPARVNLLLRQDSFIELKVKMIIVTTFNFTIWTGKHMLIEWHRISRFVNQEKLQEHSG